MENKKTEEDKALERSIRSGLKYLIAEGIVVQVGDRYRLKTEKEMAEEILAIEQGNN
jgi:hypothetical protein